MQLQALLPAVLLVISQSAVITAVACDAPAVRKEWRALSQTEQLAYLEAVQCLHGLPAQTSDVWTGTRSRYDDFHALHINMTEKIHFVVSRYLNLMPSPWLINFQGQFLPWHRMFLHLFEAELQTVCGYEGTQP